MYARGYLLLMRNGMSRSSWEETDPIKKPKQYLVAGVRRRQAKVEMTIGIDLGDVWSHTARLATK